MAKHIMAEADRHLLECTRRFLHELVRPERNTDEFEEAAEELFGELVQLAGRLRPPTKEQIQAAGRHIPANTTERYGEKE